MATAIFTRRFCFSSRKRNAGWDVQPSPDPQSFPEECIAAAVAAGAAQRVKPARKRAQRTEAKDG